MLPALFVLGIFEIGAHFIPNVNVLPSRASRECSFVSYFIFFKKEHFSMLKYLTFVVLQQDLCSPYWPQT
jgi:hypothetical protein